MTSSAPANSLIPSGRLIDEARSNGYLDLPVENRQIAIEFVISGLSTRGIARKMGATYESVRKVINDPLTRAFIADMQAEVAQHKIINTAWVENQILEIWPQLIGEEPVAMVTKDGMQYEAKKFHGPEVTSILKHFSGNDDQKKLGGTHVIINFGDMGVTREKSVVVDVSGAEDV